MTNPLKNFLVLIPIYGILIFALLYIIAAFSYPGGSSIDQTTKGFDWLHNYWCDLTREIAINGQTNSGRPIALTAMLILCSSLSVFWYFVPVLFSDNKFNAVIRFAGVSSMIVSVFLFSGFHDLVIHVAGILAIPSFALVFIGLYKNNWNKLFWYGLFCLAIMSFNYFIYETGFFISLLPIIQKVTFVLFFLWISLIDINIYHVQKSKTQINLTSL